MAIHSLSSATVEEKQLAEMENMAPFKATGINPRGFQGPTNRTFPKVKKEKLGTTVPPNGRTLQEAGDTKNPESQRPSQNIRVPFKALPVPSVIFRHRIGVPPKKPFALTVPKTPNICKTKPRQRVPADEENAPSKARKTTQTKPFAPNNTRDYSKAGAPSLPGDMITEEKRKRFKEALEREKIAMEQARQFKARPAPKNPHPVGSEWHLHEFTVQVTLRTAARPLTKPEPFSLSSEFRSKNYKEKWQKKILEEETRQMEERQFHSRPVPHAVPFLPKKSTKPLTQIEQIKLYSSERAEKRREYEERIRKREAEVGELQRREELRRKVGDQWGVQPNFVAKGRGRDPGTAEAASAQGTVCSSPSTLYSAALGEASHCPVHPAPPAAPSAPQSTNGGGLAIIFYFVNAYRLCDWVVRVL